MKFQTFFDLSTKKGKITLLTVYAGGSEVVKRCLPQFTAYKYYKLGPVSIKLIPASTLPVDPTGLSYAAGEKTVDPRDQLSPGLIRITNGENFFTDITSKNEDTQRAIYQTMMLDKRFFKWSLQTGVTRSASPRYWTIGQIRQDYYPGSITNLPDVLHEEEGKYTLEKTTAQINQMEHEPKKESSLKTRYSAGTTSSHGLFQTGERGHLGWLPTDATIQYYDEKAKKYKNEPVINAVPQIELMRIILPPAFKTIFYYRMFITEYVFFKEPVIQNAGQYDREGNFLGYFAPADRFIRSGSPWTIMPDESKKAEQGPPSPPNDGANSVRNVK